MEEKNNLQWNAKSHGTPLGYRIFLFFIKYLGLRFAYGGLVFVVSYFVIFNGASRRVIWNFYRKRLRYPRLKAMKNVYLHFYRFGQCLVDRTAIQYGQKDKFKYNFENYEEFLSVLNRGKGVVLMGAHVGAWQAGTSFFGDYGKRIHIVLVDAEYEQLKKYLDVNNNLYNMIPVNKKDSLETILAIKKALNDGEYVCFQGDRFVNEERTLTAEFLGKKARFPEGPFLLASKLRVPAVFYFSIREGRSYSFKFTIVETVCENGEKITKEELLAKYIETLEKIVKEYPQQWFNFYDFWK